VEVKLDKSQLTQTEPRDALPKLTALSTGDGRRSYEFL